MEAEVCTIGKPIIVGAELSVSLSLSQHMGILTD